MSRKKTNEEFVNEIGIVNPCITPLTEYRDSHSKIVFRCTICGQEWESYPYQELHRTGHGCAKCSYKSSGTNRRKTNDQFIKELSKVNPNITLLTPYTKSKQGVKCLCKLCNNVWESTPDRLLRGIGCPSCYHSATSFIEQFFYLALCTVLSEEKVLSRDRKAIGKELDVYIPSLGLAIEYGSWYWHKKRINKDFEKQRLCRENHIKLLLIYDVCDEESISACEDCYTYKYDLATEKSHTTVKRIIKDICDNYNLDYSVIQNNWDSITNIAHQKARKLTTEDFIELLKKKNSHRIKVLGEYKSSYGLIHCCCLDCGYEWYPRANNLLNEDAGCPQCAGTLHYSNEEFVNKVASINPSIELLEPYSRSIQSVLCRCKICGYEWNASPSRLLKKRLGCPRCIGHVRYSNEEFAKKLKSINSSITPLEPYPQNNKTKILCLCNNCGNQFSMRPNNLLAGQGCPKCSNEKRIQKSIKTQEKFVAELKAINPNIETLEPYLKSKTKLTCRCINCGHEWKATPNSLLHGYGCPICAKRIGAKKKEKRVLCVETNTIYDSLKDASIQSGLSNSTISMCCKGRHKTAGGYHWKYIEEG